MNRDKVAEGIKAYKNELPQDLVNAVLNAKAQGGNWWENLNWSQNIKLTNFLRAKDLGENAIFGPGRYSLHQLTQSGKPFFVVMLEQAFK